MQTFDLSRLGIVTLAAAALTMSGCGGGGGSTGGTIPAPGPSASAPVPVPTTPSATPTPPGSSSQTITTSAGATEGTPGKFQSNEGDTSSGGQGQTVDGISCDPTMSDNYHVHSFLGVYYNGTLMALPAGVGMENPQAPSNGFVNVASCFYYLHTHDQSGLIHVEDPNPNNLPITASMYTLKTFLDVWGISADANHFGPFQGSVRVFTSGASARTSSTVSASNLTYYGSDPNSVPLYSHEVIFVEVGTPPATLPNVYFYEQQ